jgi:hypothetical protein
MPARFELFALHAYCRLFLMLEQIQSHFVYQRHVLRGVATSVS